MIDGKTQSYEMDYFEKKECRIVVREKTGKEYEFFFYHDEKRGPSTANVRLTDKQTGKVLMDEWCRFWHLNFKGANVSFKVVLWSDYLGYTYRGKLSCDVGKRSTFGTKTRDEPGHPAPLK